MTWDVARASLYRGVINLWVEDRLGREYLSSLWANDPGIAFFVAGGNEGVRAVVADAEKAGFPNVFGVIDRDFRPTNQPHWFSPQKNFRTFVLPVHEMENYLLDPEAIAQSRLNTLNQTAEQVREHLKRSADRLAWWSACRGVIAELKRRFRDHFVPDPGCGVITDAVTAIDHICSSAWFLGLATELSRNTRADIQRLLVDAYQQAVTYLADGKWLIEYSGKEIYRDVGSHICDRQKLSGYNATSTEFDIDLAKDIASRQISNNSVPQDLSDLLKALKQRIAPNQ
jgi:hypothetical protein